ncbi:MAG: class I SAM-dependent methyltransferase [Gemmatimonadota bacterium]
MKQRKRAEITFSFGQNWQDYLSSVSLADTQRAIQDIEYWLGSSSVVGKRIADIGCGSGIQSLAFHLLGARHVHSVDVDPKSLEASRTLWDEAQRPPNWTISHGSILDQAFVETLGRWDVVYAWGMLHHTGRMWEALRNAATLVDRGGRLWISLYVKGPHYTRDLVLKKRYNAASPLGKRWILYRRIGRLMLRRVRRGKNPFGWNEKRPRGMNVYHDLVDWLGGLPYEVASEDEVVRFGRGCGLILERIEVRREVGCSVYIFSAPRNG